MTPEAQRIAISEACGWKFHCINSLGGKVWHHPDGSVGGIDPNSVDHLVPDYLNDLNAMHEAEKVLQDRCVFWPDYVDELAKMFPSSRQDQRTNWSQAIHATAAQRGEAFLRAIGKWKETSKP